MWQRALIYWLIIFQLHSVAFAEIRYVDYLPAQSGSGWDGENGTSYNGTPGDGYGYVSIEAALAAIQPGDLLFLREGTYSESFGSNLYTDMPLPVSANGTGWTAGNFTYVASYPGEWAVLDGSGTKYCAMGLCDNGHGAASMDLRFWKFERLEFTGATHGGLGIYRGPVWVRYCYFHDNGDESGDENPGGLRGYHWQNSVVEYCYFKDNGCAADMANCSHLVVFDDYCHCFEDQTETCGCAGETHTDLSGRCAMFGNTYRYNLFDGYGHTAIKHKGSGQHLTTENVDYDDPAFPAYQYAEKIHHNIEIGESRYCIMSRSDGTIIYNNICTSSSINGGGEVGVSNSKKKEFQLIFNNTLRDNGIELNSACTGSATPYTCCYGAGFGMCQSNIITKNMGYDPHEYCGISYPITPYRPWVVIRNNILADSVGIRTPDGWGTGADIMVAWRDNVHSTLEITPTNMYIDHNFHYNNSESDRAYMIGQGISTSSCDNGDQGCSVVDFDTEYSKINFSSNAAGLFAGAKNAGDASAFILSNSGSFTDGLGGATAATAGNNAQNPIYPEVLIPKYVGAVNPNDNSWVDGVIGLGSVAALTAMIGGSIPAWIEGGAGLINYSGKFLPSVGADKRMPVTPQGPGSGMAINVD